MRITVTQLEATNLKNGFRDGKSARLFSESRNYSLRVEDQGNNCELS